MKRFFALTAAFLLALALLPAAAEESGSSAAGDWYAGLGGAALRLSLNGDGSFTFSVPGSEPVTGAWELRDGFVYLDGDEDAPLAFDGLALANGDAGLFFTREPVEAYAPADPLPDASLFHYEGAWRTLCTMQDRFAVPVAFTDDDTLIYIEEARAILKGGPFGYCLVDLVLENGALTCAAGDVTVRMVIQQDGFLRLTTEKGGASETRILLRTALDSPDENE